MLIFLMFFEDFTSTLGYAWGDAGKFSHLNAIAAVSGSGLDGSEKNDPILGLFDGYMVILDAGQEVCQLGKFMIVGGKKRFRADLALNVFDDSPGDGKSIECGSSTPNLIQND